MGRVQIACSALAFNGRPLEDALVEVRALGFDAAELGFFDWPGLGHLRPRDLVRDLLGAEARIIAAAGAAGISIAAINAGTDASDPEEEARRVNALILLAHRAGARTLTLPAGHTSTSADAERLLPFVEMGRRYDVGVCAEIHVGNVTERPEDAAELARLAPGLKLTLDPSHFLIQGDSLEAWERVLPHVAHVHLRDARRGGFPNVQVPWGTGSLDLPRLLAALDRVDYAGVLSIEYITPEAVGLAPFDHVASVRALKRALEAALGGPAA